MLEGLQKRWNVSGKEFLSILCVFAVTGTTTAFVSKSIAGWVGFDEATHWAWKALLKTATLLFGYPVILLLVAFLLGRFTFFWRYEKRLLQRLHLLKKEKDVQRTEKQKTSFDGKTEDRRQKPEREN